jgi:hypothetical protein
MHKALRFFSLALVVVALVLLAGDLVSTLDRANGIVIRSLDHVWGAISAPALANFKAWLGQRIPAPGPQWAYSFMALPGWAVFGVPGVVLAFIFGGRAAHE